MPVDRAAAETFIWSTARLVDRHRYAMLFAGGQAQPVVAALLGYQNPDGGFGHALEPDLRSPESQPAATLNALEMLCEAGMLGGEMGDRARAWIASIADEDGGIPFALPGFEAYPHAPFFSLEPGSFLTFALAAVLHTAGVADDEWLERATDWCWRAIAGAQRPSGYWLEYGLRFLDSVPDEERARAAVRTIAASVNPAALVPDGGSEGEALRALDLSPRPGRPSRELVSEADVEAHLDEVQDDQRADGGWMFDWRAWSPAQTSAWRGIVTIRALSWLRDNGRPV